MPHLIEILKILFELSVLSMGLSLLLINRIVEASIKEEALMEEGEKRYAIVYFSLLFFTSISSLLIMLINDIFWHDAVPSCLALILYTPILAFVIALVILWRLVFKIYKVAPYVGKAEARSEKKSRTNEDEEAP